MMHLALQAAAVFAALTVLDGAWAFYTLALNGHRPICAASWSALIVALGGFAAVNYADNWLMIAPAAAGAFLGTILAMWWSKRA